MNEHATTLILKRPYASFDPAGLVMRVDTGVGEALIVALAGVLPLPTGKDAIVRVVVAYLYPISAAEILERSFRLADIITILGLHQMDIAEI
jgi:hypothetical protein